MTELQEQSTKKLAELKAYLEKRVAEHEEEIGTLRSFLGIVDTLLAERSYRKMEITQTIMETTPARTTAGTQAQSIRTMAGIHLANIYVEDADLIIVPSEIVKFDVNAAPLRTFLIGKVLEPMKTKDLEAVQKQELSPDRVLSYKLDQESNILKQLHIKNFGDDRRLNEIRNGVRWTLRKMYEKTIGT
ncbi:MAG TPA: hypothetical protein VIK88_00230 [Candidatus Bathyarchaeia archaeon]